MPEMLVGWVTIVGTVAGILALALMSSQMSGRVRCAGISASVLLVAVLLVGALTLIVGVGDEEGADWPRTDGHVTKQGFSMTVYHVARTVDGRVQVFVGLGNATNVPIARDEFNPRECYLRCDGRRIGLQPSQPLSFAEIPADQVVDGALVSPVIAEGRGTCEFVCPSFPNGIKFSPVDLFVPITGTEGEPTG